MLFPLPQLPTNDNKHPQSTIQPTELMDHHDNWLPDIYSNHKKGNHFWNPHFTNEGTESYTGFLINDS